MLQRASVLTLFPTLVWTAELEDGARERVGRAVLERLDTGADAPLRQLAAGQSWQSDQDLHRLPELADLVAAIERMTTGVLEFLRVGHEGFAITACWANVLAPGAEHRAHHHPNNFLSGVYYVSVAEGADTLQFHDPRAQVRVIRPPVRALTGENTDLVVTRVKPGTLVLFPAWLEHSVPPNRSAQNRISLSFNVMFSRYSETMTRPLWDSGYR